MHNFDLIGYLILMSTLIHPFKSKTCITDVCWSCHISDDPLTLSCGHGKIVAAIIKAGYREKHSTDTSCIYKPHSDCFDEAGNYSLLKQVTNCVWRRQNCSFNTVAGRPRTGQCSLTMRAKYLIATHFHCVNVLHLHTLCVTNTPQIQSTINETQYLISPGFPIPYVQFNGANYKQSLCRVNIRTQPGFGLKIWTIYIDVHIEDKIKISQFSKSVKEEIYSGNRPFEVHIPSDSVLVEFITLNIIHAHIGFAIKYTSTTSQNISRDVHFPRTSINTHQIIFIAVTFFTILGTVVFMACFIICTKISPGYNSTQQSLSNPDQEQNNVPLSVDIEDSMGSSSLYEEDFEMKSITGENL